MVAAAVAAAPQGGGTETEAASKKDVVVRQRRSHRKSRLGCGNCKLRGVKCDESKPACRRCASSGFTCHYSASAPALQLAHAGSFKIELDPGLPAPNPQRRIPIAMPVTGRRGHYELTPFDYAALDRFQRRTIWTMGSTSTRLVMSDRTWKIATVHPFLSHVLIALSLIHDASLSPVPLSASSRALLAFHWYHGTVLFSEQLSQPRSSLDSSQRDALWAASSMLGAAAFGHVESDDPYANWPLAPPSPLDLDWLKMGEGKKVVWEIADPQRSDSLFSGIAADMAASPAPNGRAPISPCALPAAFYALFDLDVQPERDSSLKSAYESTCGPHFTTTTTSSSPDPDSSSSATSITSYSSCDAENPYQVPASVLAQLLPHRITQQNLLSFLSFTSQLSRTFKWLLETRDPRALLLLAWWFSQTAAYEAWWLHRRSVVEGIAICLYLEERCADDPVILGLVRQPKAALEEIRARSAKWSGKDAGGGGKAYRKGRLEGRKRMFLAPGDGTPPSEQVRFAPASHVYDFIKKV